MASLTYTDLQTRAANAFRIPTTNTTEMAKIQAVINAVYRDVAKKRNWKWREARQIINTVAKITTGTVALTNGSTTATFSSAPTVSVAGYVLLIPTDTTDSGVVMRVSSHTASSTSATLDAAFTGTTATAATYRLYRDTYSLASDTSNILHIKRYGYPWPLSPVGPTEMLALKQYDLTESKPEVWTQIGYETSGDPTTAKQLVVHPYPDDTYRLEVLYERTLNTEVSSTTRFLIPDDDIEVLYYGVLGRGYVIFLKDHQSSRYFTNLFNEALALMVIKDQELVEDTPQVQPRDDYRSFYSRGRRTTGNTDFGDFFDRFPIRF